MPFHARHAVHVAGITYKQLDHCLRSGFLRPSGGGGHGHGSPRRFNRRDLVALAVLGDVLRAGVSVSAVAPALRLVQRGRSLPPLGRLCDVAVWTDGRRAVVVQRGRLAKARASPGVSYLLDVGAAAQRVLSGLRESGVSS